MKDSIEKDNKLLERLDCILAGKESESAGAMDDDMRTTLDVARRMASLREIPSEKFTINLKAQLVHQLAEQEKTELIKSQGFSSMLNLRKTKWQGTIAAVILVIIIAIILLIVLLINQPG